MAGHKMNGDGLTVPQRMLKLLSDGKFHTAQELHGCLHDDMGPLENINAHITNIRKVLRPKGEDIYYREKGGVSWYMHGRVVGIS